MPSAQPARAITSAPPSVKPRRAKATTPGSQQRRRRKARDRNSEPASGSSLAGRGDSLQDLRRGQPKQQGELGQATRRARRRQAVVPQPSRERLLPWLSLLAANSVRPKTQTIYVKHLLQVAAWLCTSVLPQWSMNVWDTVLSEYISWLYEKGDTYGTANRTLAAALWGLHGTRGPIRSAFPESHQALLGWKRLEPPCSRPPVPFEMMMLIVEDFMQRAMVDMALLTLVLFETYMRPSEAFALSPAQVIPPALRTAGSGKFLTFIVYPEELRVPNKTREYDHSIPLDLERQQFLVGPLLELCRRRQDSTLLWPFQYGTFYEEFTEVVFRLGLSHSGATIYGLRHGGASHDRSVNTRDLLGVQQRGAWRSQASVRRYEKHGR